MGYIKAVQHGALDIIDMVLVHTAEKNSRYTSVNMGTL